MFLYKIRTNYTMSFFKKSLILGNVVGLKFCFEKKKKKQ